MPTPIFLTRDLAIQAVEAALAMVTGSSIGKALKRQAFHIVILVPNFGLTSDAPKPELLYEYSFGDKGIWTANYQGIAKSKAFQLWYGRNDDRTDIIPHLLIPSDTPFWGGVNRRGFVVTCSGVQPWFDKMISGIISDIIVGLTHDAWILSKQKKDDDDFLY